MSGVCFNPRSVVFISGVWFLCQEFGLSLEFGFITGVRFLSQRSVLSQEFGFYARNLF